MMPKTVGDCEKVLKSMARRAAIRGTTQGTDPRWLEVATMLRDAKDLMLELAGDQKPKTRPSRHRSAQEQYQTRGAALELD